MCGIVGSVGIEHNAEAQDAAMRLVKHRGPDDEGTWTDASVFFGHVRLSILDTSDLGHQPMASEDGRFVLIFNGEIYNHLDIRKDLVHSGFSFRSMSDTETLLAGLIQWGSDFIPRLNGIFAFAFYDIKLQTVLIVRDHFGVKPLYYSASATGIVFSSEAKAIFPLIHEKTLEPRSLANYLTFLWCAGEGTPVKEIRKLLPGHFLEVSAKDGCVIRFVKYYEIPFTGRYEFNSERETVDKLEEKIQAAVKRQLLSDVPVGFFLSGGLDSSLLAAVARKIKEDRIQCFTIDAKVDDSSEGFENDLPYAKKVAGQLDADLEIVKADFDIVRDFDRMIWHLDEPQADPAPLNVLNISARASSMGFKVLIGGTAGDDVFSGYRRHRALLLERWFKFVPGFVADLVNSLPLNLRVSSLRRLRKVALQLGKPIEERLANYYFWMVPDRAIALLSDDCNAKVGSFQPAAELLALLQNIPDENSWLNRMLYWEMKTFMVDHNLNYTDKMGMANGVEIRVPYLDVELVRFACSIDPALKLKDGEVKYILKKVAERYLPKDVIYRNKTGFGAPVRKWIVEELDPMISDRFENGKITEKGVFDKNALWTLITENKMGRVDASYTIWALLAIDSWIDQFIPNNKH